MTCEQCSHEATIHLTESVNGQIRELHLCGACARKVGLAPPSSPPELALDVVLKTLIKSHVGELISELAQCACPCCGMKFMEFRGEGRLGCPYDYAAFSRGLEPILRQAHGATRHVGKIPGPRPRPDPVELLKLRGRLRAAVAREDFERAVQLRDQIRQNQKDSLL